VGEVLPSLQRTTPSPVQQCTPPCQEQQPLTASIQRLQDLTSARAGFARHRVLRSASAAYADGKDGALLMLRKERGSATSFKRIKAGKATVMAIARERGIQSRGALTRYLKPGWRAASEEERRAFIEWLSQEVDLDKYLRRPSTP
jgi:hypothetical protein